MAEALFSTDLLHLQAKIEEVTRRDIAPRAAAVDEHYEWPVHSMNALAAAGLMGLVVPKRVGGHGEGLLALAMATEIIGRACASSALCFGMHCVGAAVIAAKATAQQESQYLRGRFRIAQHANKWG